MPSVSAQVICSISFGFSLFTLQKGPVHTLGKMEVSSLQQLIFLQQLLFRHCRKKTYVSLSQKNLCVVVTKKPMCRCHEKTYVSLSRKNLCVVVTKKPVCRCHEKNLC